jgi:putative ABC transport system permease protein
VGGLLLSQAVARQKELGLRAALGSSRTRILRQLVTENVLLSCAAGVLGIVLAWIGLRAFVNTGLSAYRDLQHVTLDWTVIGFAIVISLATALVFGILPALQLSRVDVVEVVRDAGRGATAGPTRSRLRGAFVVAQVALALVLLVATGLLTRSLLRLNAVDTGINPERLLALELPMPRAFYRNTSANTSAGGLLVEFDSRFSDVTERLRERFASVPGVQSVAATTPPPLGGTPRRVLFRKDSWLALADDREPWSAEWYPISADFFETLQVPVLQGRTFTRQDAQPTPPVAIINASMAARYWPNDNPIGRLLQTDVLDDPPRQIVGVVGDVRQDRYQSAPVPQVYVPRTQLPSRMDMQMGLEVLQTTLVVRAAGDAVPLVPALRAAVRDVDATISVASARTVEDYAADQLQELSQYARRVGSVRRDVGHARGGRQPRRHGTGGRPARERDCRAYGARCAVAERAWTRAPSGIHARCGRDRCRPGRICDADARHWQPPLGRHDHGSADARSGRPCVGGRGTGGLLSPGSPRAEGGAGCGVARRLTRSG